MTPEERKKIAYDYMVQGYNCCQSTVLAFKDILPIDAKELEKMTSSMGGGVGQMRSVCGAVSGMALVMGMLKGCTGTDKDEKAAVNTMIKEYGAKFKAANGSIDCFDLTGLSETNKTPIKREDGRDCKDFVADFVYEIAKTL